METVTDGYTFNVWAPGNKDIVVLNS